MFDTGAHPSNKKPLPGLRGEVTDRFATATVTGQNLGMPKRDAVTEVRRLCLAFPEVSERLSHGAPTWFIRDKKTLATVWEDHHGDGILGLICAAPAGVQQQLVDEEPDRFYVPAYVGHRGWIGVRLDRKVDWQEINEILVDAYRCVAPAKLVAQLDADVTRSRGTR
jgi:hypothetical protein